MKKTVLVATFIAALGAVGYATQWRYDHVPQSGGGSILVRTNRFSGRVEALTRNGWGEMDALVRHRFVAGGAQSSLPAECVSYFERKRQWEAAQAAATQADPVNQLGQPYGFTDYDAGCEARALH